MKKWSRFEGPVAVAVVAAMVISIGIVRADRAASLPAEAVRVVTVEPGVVPPGAALVVQTNDAVRTDRALPSTIYEATVAADLLDQHGNLLIPKDSQIELAVFSFSFLGPGGAGASELVLGVQDVVVNGVHYPVKTAESPEDGGLGASRHTNVPTGALLKFETIDPIRLRGYGR